MMKKIQTEKIIGYLLLILGIGIIIYTAISVYQVFTGKNDPVDLFSFSSIGLDLPEMEAVEDSGTNQKSTQELISSDLINKPSNIFAHVILMGFIASAGFKFAQLSVMLLRPVKVNLLGLKNTVKVEEDKIRTSD